MASKLDITNMKFGKLTAIKPNGFYQSPSRKHILWLCKCDCGIEKTVRLNSLRSGKLQSCGCLLKAGNNKTHGMSRNNNRTPEYTTWCKIKQRCLNKNSKDYFLYGGRGITISNEWLNSFETFFNDMGLKPSKNYSIDRIDNSKGYSKENCRWATNFTQSRNKRTNRFYELNNMNMCMTDWADYLGISFTTLNERLTKWTLEKSLTTFKEN
jgi:hypothetical protein